MKNHSLSFNGFVYTISKEPSESNDIFMKRLWYIAKKNPKTEEELSKILNYSLIWRNTHYYNMEYNENLLRLI